jgi:cytochrome P450
VSIGTDCPGYAPSDPAFVADPYPVYRELRARQPAFFHEPTGQWVVSRYADVNALLRDRRLGRSYLHVASHEEFGREPEPPELAPFWNLIRNGMLDVEPPVHRRLRAAVSAAFTPRLVEDMRPRIRELARRLAAGLAADGGGDLIARLAEPLPVTVIADLLGVPEPDRRLLRPWSADICGMYELNPGAAAQQRAVRAATEFSGYLRDLARARRSRPGADLISALTAAPGLSEDEVIGTCVLLLNAGHEATVNAAGNGWRALLAHEGELRRLYADPALVGPAVEELLRYDTPLQMFERWVLADIEVAGTAIPRGSEVALLFGSANRDPAVFDDPDRLDVGRQVNPHIGFGAGIHYCLGAPLARIELTESFGAMLALGVQPRLRAEPAHKDGYVIRGLRSLEVELRGSPAAGR